MWTMAGRTNVPILRVMQFIALVFVATPFVFAGALALLGPREARPWAFWACLGAGVLGLVTSQVAARAPLRGSDAAGLANAYRSRFFVALALADTGTVLSAILSYMGGDIVTYSVGASFGLAAIVALVPSTGRLEAEQRRLFAQGANVSLVEALAMPANQVFPAVHRPPFGR
jgi:hypothetical protein